jgi:hypothetical protein
MRSLVAALYWTHISYRWRRRPSSLQSTHSPVRTSRAAAASGEHAKLPHMTCGRCHKLDILPCFSNILGLKQRWERAKGRLSTGVSLGHIRKSVPNATPGTIFKRTKSIFQNFHDAFLRVGEHPCSCLPPQSRRAESAPGSVPSPCEGTGEVLVQLSGPSFPLLIIPLQGDAKALRQICTDEFFASIKNQVGGCPRPWPSTKPSCRHVPQASTHAPLRVFAHPIHCPFECCRS